MCARNSACLFPAPHCTPDTYANCIHMSTQQVSSVGPGSHTTTNHKPQHTLIFNNHFFYVPTNITQSAQDGNFHHFSGTAHSLRRIR